MSNDTYTYDLECELCEVETEVVVKGEDEKPLFCPMCGNQLSE